DEQLVGDATGGRGELRVGGERLQLVGGERAAGGLLTLGDGTDRGQEPVRRGRVGVVERFERRQERRAPFADERPPRRPGVVVAAALLLHRLDGGERPGGLGVGLSRRR